MISNTLRYLPIILSLHFCAGVITSAQEIKEEVEKIIGNTFGEEVSYMIQKYSLSPEIKKKIEIEVKQRFFDEYIYIYTVSLDDTTIAYGFLDNVYGKTMPITFLVLLTTEGNIISSDIIKYREPYGGEVSNESWNDQFTGKNSKSDFTVGKTISSISGVTISVNSVTKGIRKLILLYQSIKDEL